VGARRDHQDPHIGFEQQPKLITAGRLDGTLDGRPVSIIANADTITLHATRGSIGSLLNHSKALRPMIRSIAGRSGLRVRVKIDRMPAVRLVGGGAFSRLARALVGW